MPRRVKLGLLLAILACFGAAPAVAQVSGTVGFEVFLPLRNQAALDALLEDLHRPGSPQFHRWLTPAQFTARFGIPASTAARLRGALAAQGLHAEVSGSHSLHVTGDAAVIERVLTARLAQRGRRLVAEGRVVLPPALAEAGAVVAAFDPAIRMRRHSHTIPAIQPDNRNGTTGNYWFDDLKQAYSFPAFSVATGAGASIGVLMAGDFLPSDMTTYFSHENLAVPNFTSTPVLGGAPFDPAGDSAETTLDLQQTGGMAPNANITLYNIPDLSDASILAGLTTMIEANKVDVVSMSFGGPELGYTAAYNSGVDYTALLGTYDSLYKQGVSQGITFVASSGDSGALSIPASACFATGAKKGCGVFLRSVQYPASSPYVTGVGGTNLVTVHITKSFDSTYTSENANYDPLGSDSFFNTPATGVIWGSGGGISTYFAQPSYQTGISSVSRKWRLVPDVALHMGGCPGSAVFPCGPNRSGDISILNGATVGVIGTSAAAPDFAGLLALRVQLTHGRLGNENYRLYTLARAQAAGAKPLVFRTTISGNNGYATTPGYNLVLGNGTVFGAAYLGVANQPLAGIPKSASNP